MEKVTEKMGKGNNIFCAIDLHQRSMMAGIALGRGSVRYREYRTDEDGIFELLGDLFELREASPGSEVWATYEASGCGFRLADIFKDHGLRVSVLAPTHLPQNPKSRSAKTDKRDVVRLLEVLRGHVLAGNDLPSVWIPSAQVRDDREIVRRRLSIRDRGKDVKNSILGLLRRYGLEKPADLSTNWSKKHLAWIESLLPNLLCGAASQLESLLRELAFFMEECGRLDKQVAQLAGQDRHLAQVASLTLMKGVGILTAMVYLTELGDLSRFDNRRALGNYLGLTPRSWESGEIDDRKGHITKLGPARIRKVLNQAAWSAVTFDEGWREWFRQRTPQGKYKRKMIVAVMRLMAIRMWRAGLAAA